MKTAEHGQQLTTSVRDAKKTVLSFIDALNNDDFAGARTYVSRDMIFEGVLGTRNGADAYFWDMEKMRLKYNIQKVFKDGDDVCLFYNIEMSGKTIFSAGWYRTNDGKINSIRVVFDPRPLLNDESK